LAGRTSDDQIGDGWDRRRLLKRVALGAGLAGVAWTAPVLTSTASAGPGSCTCTPQPVNLLAAPFGNNVTVTTGGARVVNGSSLTFARQGAGTITNTTCVPSGSWTNAQITNCLQGNISSGQIAICQRGDQEANALSLTINFNPAVQELAFVLTDIDAHIDGPGGNVNYRERVTISWTNATGTSVPVYTPGAMVQPGPAANQYQCSSTNFNAPSNSVACNLGVDFGCGGTISQVRIVSQDINPTPGTSNTFGRMIGLAQLAFCPPA
jgi:hypothetical protein